MKSKRLSRLSCLTRILCYGTIVVLALTSVGLWMATASTQLTPSSLPPSLPTRPSPPQPKPEKPSKPEPQPPTPTPAPTTPPPPLARSPIYFVLPNNPSTTDLSAAATIAAGLGKFSNGEIRLASATDTQVPTDVRDNHHLIVIGRKGTNRFLDQLDLPLRLDDPALSEGQGVIQEMVSPWNPMRMILVVTGHSDDGLSQASRALNRKAHLISMQGAVAIVQSVSPPEPVESRQLDVDFTIADLGYEEEVVYGTGIHTLDYHFSMPMGFTFDGEPRFNLYFGHARIASPTKSFLDVRLNGVPIGSAVLDESNTSSGSLEVSLPSRLIRPRRNEIRISIAINLDNQDLVEDTEQLWAAVYSHSSLHLPFTAQDVELSLDLFPYPFDKRPSLSGLLLVLPDHARRFDYDLMLPLAAGLGDADRGEHLALDVTTADLFTTEDWQDRDLFLIGRPTAHSLIAELNDALPQPFEPDSDLLHAQFDPVVYRQDPSQNIGVIEELAAPWDPERTILILTGTTDEGVVLASTTLFSQRDNLAGNVVFVEESLGIRTLDTHSLTPTPVSQPEKPAMDRSLLIQLGERWW